MIKTLLTALFTYLGLKGAEYAINKIAGIIRIVLFLLVLLVGINIAIPFSIWYVKSLGKSLKPVTDTIGASFKSMDDQIQASHQAEQRARDAEETLVNERIAAARLHYPLALYVTMEGGREIDTEKRYSKQSACETDGVSIKSESSGDRRWDNDNTRDSVIDFNCRAY